METKSQNPKTIQGQKLTAGFTLIETLVYIAIFVILSVAITGTFVTLSKSYHALSSRKNLNNSAQTILNRISYEVKRADSIDVTNSTFNSTSSRLVLNYKNTDNTTSKYYFYLDNSSVKIKKDSTVEGGLNLPDVKVNSFYVYTPTGTSSNAVLAKIFLTAGDRSDDFEVLTAVRAF